MDNGNVTLLLLIDLTSAFDTVDHQLLVRKLELCNVRDNALRWFKDYLNERSQMVNIGSRKSSYRSIESGVPQGSVLGPVLFSVYMKGIGEEVNKHGFQYKLYADDVMIYLSCSVQDIDNALVRLERCVTDVTQWLSKNSLILNASKTEFLIVGTARQQKKLGQKTISVDGTNVKSCQSVRYLGIEIDNTLSMEKQVQKTNKAAYCNLRLLYRIARYMDRKTRVTAANALVASNLEFCISLYCGLPKKLLKRMERVLRSMRKFILGTNDQVAVVTENNEKLLHVEQMIQLRVMCIVHAVVNRKAPNFLCELLANQTSSQNLRSAIQENLVIPRTAKAIGDRAFSVIGPKLWNNLSLDDRRLTSCEAFRGRVKGLLLEKFN
jgi:hypothetical protein